MDKKYKLLQELFGHKGFRAFQEEIVDTILDGHDVLSILPTGGGKSLCYQLPTLLKDGVCVVISPLIALMQDQVKALNELNLAACMINSMQEGYKNFETIQALQKGELKFLYIAPERLLLNDFIDVLKSVKIDYFVIDEAHCVSAWGHEFRISYRNLGVLKELFPLVNIAAFTATATRKVQEDIIKSLKLHSPRLFRAQTKRDNLLIKVEKRFSNAHKQILNFLHSHKNECGIIYTFTRKEAEKIAHFLQENSYEAMAYHAGLPTDERQKVYEHFAYEKIQIVVATIAFGMGIDKSNIRFVIHTSLPKTIENYYQEIGRAGRDGEISTAYLLYANGDKVKRMHQIEEAEDEHYKKLSYDKLDAMYRFCISSKCRHGLIANYFEDNIKPCQTMCDNCTKGEVELIDISVEAQKLLSCVYRTGQIFGRNHIIDVLRGSKAKKIEELNHHKLTVYGIGANFDKQQWMSIVFALLDQDVLEMNEHKSLKITLLGMRVLKGEDTISMEKALLETKQEIIKEEQPKGIYEEIFERFRELRKKLSNELQVPAYIIFDDKTLRQICEKLPQNDEEFLSINGVGAVKLEKYGKAFFQLIQTIQEEYKEKIPKTKLTKTHLETLELISQNLSVQEMANRREVSQNTILLHIKTLKEHEKISTELAQTLFKSVQIPQNIISWIQDGLQLDNSKVLRNYLYMYETLNS